jgi:hypothetical protein
MFLLKPEICGCLVRYSSRPDRKIAVEPVSGGLRRMVARVRTVAFQGIEAVPVDVQVMIAPGRVGMQMVRRINFFTPCALS